jgi:hypothetical protein
LWYPPAMSWPFCVGLDIAICLGYPASTSIALTG